MILGDILNAVVGTGANKDNGPTADEMREVAGRAADRQFALLSD